MSYEYKIESKVFFWIFSLFITTIIFSIIYYSFVADSNFNKLYLFILYLVCCVGIFLIGVFLTNVTTFLYSIIQPKDYFSKDLKNSNDSENNLKMIKRYKEVFYNLDFGDKEKSIDIIQRTVGFSDVDSRNVYSILKNLIKNKTFLVLSGIIISLIVYVILTSINVFFIVKESIFLPISVSLIIFLIFIFESVSISKLPVNFYMNIINVNRKKLIENKKDLAENQKKLNLIFKEKEAKKDKIIHLVSFLINKNIKKKDIIDMLTSQGVESSELKDLILDASEGYRSIETKTTYDEVSSKIDEIILLYTEIKNIDVEIFTLKKKIIKLKKIQETIEKINSDDWDYYRNINLDLIRRSKDFEKNIDEEILNKINKRNELEQNRGYILKNLYESFLPYKDTLTKERISSILISKGYSYEMLSDILDEFKKNNIDLDKNKRSLQDKFVSKINSFYDSFRN
jgi:hypothetical protein